MVFIATKFPSFCLDQSESNICWLCTGVDHVIGRFFVRKTWRLSEWFSFQTWNSWWKITREVAVLQYFLSTVTQTWLKQEVAENLKQNTGTLDCEEAGASIRTKISEKAVVLETDVYEYIRTFWAFFLKSLETKKFSGLWAEFLAGFQNFFNHPTSIHHYSNWGFLDQLAIITAPNLSKNDRKFERQWAQCAAGAGKVAEKTSTEWKIFLSWYITKDNNTTKELIVIVNTIWPSLRSLKHDVDNGYIV